MKNIFLKTISGTALAILMLTMLVHVRMSAQEPATEEKTDVQTQEDSLARRENTKKLEGSWNTLVTPRNCVTGVPMTTSPSMLTFMRGGTLQETGTRIAPSLRGPGHGIWSYDSRGQYTATFQFFRFNADGTLAGRQIVIQHTTLSPDGDSFTAVSTARILDVNGNVIQNNCSTGVGTRFE
ncbi:MAG: hypothetical protein ABIP78_10575 [Pyrinomonadaceae bacterium]